MTTVERALNSIGKKCFINYYEEFQSYTDKNALAKQLLANNKNATSLSAQMTRINYAQWIFDNKKEKEALSLIIKSNRLDEATKKTAREYLNNL